MSSRDGSDMSKQMFLTIMPLMLISFGVVLYYMIAITKIEYGGVHKLTPDYLETYNHCTTQGED